MASKAAQSGTRDNMASRFYKRIRRKPLPGSDNSGLEEPPPPYYYSENATVSTINVVKPFASYVENQAVEDVRLDHVQEREVVVLRRGAEQEQEHDEMGSGSLEAFGRWERSTSLENEELPRGHENVEGRLPEPPVPPPAPPVPRKHASLASPPVAPRPRRGVPPPPPPPRPPRNSVPPPVPPKVLSWPAAPPPTATASSEAQSVREPESIPIPNGGEEDNSNIPNDEEEEDDGNASDASDDSYIAAKRQSLYRIQQADALSLQKLNITQAAEREAWGTAFELLSELVESMEERGDVVPLEWYLDFVRFGITASRMPPAGILSRLPSNTEDADGENTTSKDLQMQAIILEGIVATKKEDEKASIRWFLKGSRFARKHEFTNEMNICHWMLKEKYRKSGEAKEEQLYTSLTPSEIGLTDVMGILKPRVFTTKVMNESLNRERCIRILDELLLRKDVKENEEKKQKYRQILEFVSAHIFPSLPSCTLIANIYEMEKEEVFQLVKSANFIFRMPTDADSLVMFQDNLIPKIIRRLDGDPGHYFSDKDDVIHSRIALQLLSLMKKSLKEDICDIKAYGTPTTQFGREIVERAIPKSLEYACCRWLHYCRHGELATTSSILQNFLEEHWLHWIEAMTLLNSVSSVASLNVGEDLTALRSREGVKSLAPAVGRRIENLEKFMMRYHEAINDTPLQVYYLWKLFEFEENTASSSAPKTTLKIDIHDSQNQDATFKRLEEGYKNLLTIIKPGTNEKQKVTFSSDLRLVAYIIPDSPIVIVKDLTITKSEGVILEHGQKQVYEIHFSPQVATDNILAMVTDPTQVMLWNTSNGKLVKSYYPEYTNERLSITFSQDGKLIAFLGARYRVAVRRTSTGEQLWKVSNKSALLIQPVILGMSFREDSSVLAMVSSDCCVQTATDSSSFFTRGFKWGHTGGIDDADILYLNDEKKRMLVRAKYKGVFIVEEGTKSEEVTLDGGDALGRRMVAVVSPNQRRIAVIRDRGPIMIFDTASGKCIQTFYRMNQVYGETTLAAVFLPSGDRLITVSKEMGMRVWELMVDVQVKDGWVMRGNEKVMWIPGNYHARSAEVERGNWVVLTHPSGRVIEIEIGIGKGRAAEGLAGYGLVSSVMAYLPSLPVSLPRPRFPSFSLRG
ncbi:hypothetical protein TWF281_000318 [Arthrobotrys megalospora]